MKKKLNVGDEVYIAMEHFYYEKRRAGPLKEFCVYKAAVQDFYKGRYVDFKAVIVAHIANNLVYCKLSDLDKRLAFRNHYLKGMIPYKLDAPKAKDADEYDCYKLPTVMPGKGGTFKFFILAGFLEETFDCCCAVVNIDWNLVSEENIYPFRVNI